MAVVPMEIGLWRLRTALEIREENLEHKSKSIWSKIGLIWQYTDILRTGISLLIILLLLTFSVFEFTHIPKSFSLHIVLYTITTLGYFVLRRLLGGKGKSIIKQARKGNPTYQLTEDGITIKLVTMMSSGGSGLKFDILRYVQECCVNAQDDYSTLRSRWR